MSRGGCEGRPCPRPSRPQQAWGQTKCRGRWRFRQADGQASLPPKGPGQGLKDGARVLPGPLQIPGCIQAGQDLPRAWGGREGQMKQPPT